MIRIDIYLESPAAILAVGSFGAGALIRIESSPTLGGSYAGVGTIAVDTTTAQPFTFWDPAGSATTYYRWRVSDSGNAVQSGYSSPQLGSSPTDTVASDAYASLGDLLPLFETPPKPSRYARLNGLLRTATAELITEMGGRDYFRHPTTGSGSWFGSVGRTYVSRGRDEYGLLHVHTGIVALDTLEVSQDLGGSFTTVTPGDYVLRGANPESTDPLPPGEPAFHVLFTGIGTVQGFPRGVNVVRLTGAYGWPAIPRPVVEGVAERARQLAYADPSFTGSVVGPPEFGAGGQPSERWPQILYRWLESERHRFWCQV